jgi:hypothetical protein
VIIKMPARPVRALRSEEGKNAIVPTNKINAAMQDAASRRRRMERRLRRGDSLPAANSRRMKGLSPNSESRTPMSTTVRQIEKRPSPSLPRCHEIRREMRKVPALLITPLAK